jgi:hypothetical protein
LVEDIAKSDIITAIDKVFADGTCEDNKIFRHLLNNGALPCIKVRKNAKFRLKKAISLKYIIYILEKRFE